MFISLKYISRLELATLITDSHLIIRLGKKVGQHIYLNFHTIKTFHADHSAQQPVLLKRRTCHHACQ